MTLGSQHHPLRGQREKEKERKDTPRHLGKAIEKRDQQNFEKKPQIIQDSQRGLNIWMAGLLHH